MCPNFSFYNSFEFSWFLNDKIIFYFILFWVARFFVFPMCSNEVPNSISLCPICFAQSCFLGTYIGLINIDTYIFLCLEWVHYTCTCLSKVIKFGPWWVLWVHVCPWLIHAPKCYNYALTNLLFSLCRSMWVSEALISLPSPILEL